MKRTLAILGVAAALPFAAPANATPIDDYRIENAEYICQALDEAPTFDGIYSIAMVIIAETDMTEEQAGDTIARAVIGWCPQHEGLIKDFAAQGEAEFKE